MLIYETTIEESTLKESSTLVTDSFPFRTANCDAYDYPCGSFPWHWHEEIEVLYMIEGKLLIRIPEYQLTISEGDVIFLPSNILHSSAVVDGFAGIHKEFIFSPSFIGGSYNSLIMQKYVLPLAHPDVSYILVKKDSPNSPRLQELLTNIYSYALNEPAGYEIKIHNLLETAWIIFMDEAKNQTDRQPFNFTGRERLFEMLDFIRGHYCEEITLNDIASSAGVSTRECNRCFKTGMQTTTMEYLLEYRINKACEMLMDPAMSISEIGQSCGFSSASYFTKRFREKCGLTPKEYRQKKYPSRPA